MKRTQRKGLPGVAYLIRCRDTGRLKVGVSRAPAERLLDLQCSSPTTLELFATAGGGPAPNAAWVLEARLLDRFAGQLVRAKGEWLHAHAASDAIVAFIEGAASLGLKVSVEWA
jgi:hypothetical protein